MNEVRVGLEDFHLTAPEGECTAFRGVALRSRIPPTTNAIDGGEGFEDGLELRIDAYAG
jgi:hypothetical protein